MDPISGKTIQELQEHGVSAREDTDQFGETTLNIKLRHPNVSFSDVSGGNAYGIPIPIKPQKEIRLQDITDKRNIRADKIYAQKCCLGKVEGEKKVELKYSSAEKVKIYQGQLNASNCDLKKIKKIGSKGKLSNCCISHAMFAHCKLFIEKSEHLGEISLFHGTLELKDSTAKKISLSGVDHPEIKILNSKIQHLEVFANQEKHIKLFLTGSKIQQLSIGQCVSINCPSKWYHESDILVLHTRLSYFHPATNFAEDGTISQGHVEFLKKFTTHFNDYADRKIIRACDLNQKQPRKLIVFKFKNGKYIPSTEEEAHKTSPLKVIDIRRVAKDYLLCTKVQKESQVDVDYFKGGVFSHKKGGEFTCLKPPPKVKIYNAKSNNIGALSIIGGHIEQPIDLDYTGKLNMLREEPN